jgi:hypothetical protein
MEGELDGFVGGWSTVSALDNPMPAMRMIAGMISFIAISSACPAPALSADREAAPAFHARPSLTLTPHVVGRRVEARGPGESSSDVILTAKIRADAARRPKRARHRVRATLYLPDDFFGCGRGDASRIGGDVTDQGICSADPTCIGLDLQRPAVVAANDMAAQREVGKDEG